MDRFIKRPVEVEAVQFIQSIERVRDILEWVGISGDVSFISEGGTIVSCQVKTLEGVMVANPGDWIIKGIKGEFYPCKHDIFVESYESTKPLEYMIKEDEVVPPRDPHPEVISEIKRVMEALDLDEMLNLIKGVDYNARNWGIAHGKALASKEK